MFFPETPRWLVMKDRREEAAAILAKYHGDGDANAPIVTLQISEIVADMADSRNDNPWWDFKVRSSVQSHIHAHGANNRYIGTRPHICSPLSLVHGHRNGFLWPMVR